ncbi:MAG: DUF1667 domain-containing protein, partial [Anaerovorax sp.]
KSDADTDSGYTVSGNGCKQGIDYSIKEVSAPERILTTTVKIKGAYARRLPVITSGSIPKEKLFQVMRELDTVEVEAPIRQGSVVRANMAQTGVSVIASRSMKRKEDK